MKKFISLLSLFFVLTQAYSQIPNKNFETWSNGADNPPNGWIDHGSPFLGFHPASQSTDKYLGNYAVKIETKISGSDTAKGVISTIRPGNKEGFGPSFPVNSRVLNLKGYYKYYPQNGDSAMIIVFLTKTGYVGTWGNMLGWGHDLLGAASTYTPFSIGYLDSANFIYMAAGTPDSGYLEISTFKQFSESSENLKPRGNSLMYVDALNFDSYLSGSIKETLIITENFKLYPNVISKGIINVEFETKTTDYTTIRIFDLNGKEVKSFYKGELNSGKHNFYYNISDISDGNYLFLISTPNGYKAEQICVTGN